jgi:hypothetical protein
MSRIANDSMACCEEETEGMGSIAPNRPRVLMHTATIGTFHYADSQVL